MASYNRVILAGNLTRDVELRYTPKGTTVAKLGVAVNRKWKSEGGDEKSETTFVDVDAFGKQAEVIAKYFKKGKPILLEGRLRLDQWEKDGQKHQKLGVVLESFSFVGGGDKEASGPPAAATRQPAAPEQSEEILPF